MKIFARTIDLPVLRKGKNSCQIKFDDYGPYVTVYIIAQTDDKPHLNCIESINIYGPDALVHCTETAKLVMDWWKSKGYTEVR